MHVATYISVVLIKFCFQGLDVTSVTKKSNANTWVVKHSKTQSHLEQAHALSSQLRRLSFGNQPSDEVPQWTAAELKIAVVAAASNIPLAFHDRLSPTIRSIFPDSKLAISLSIHKGHLHAKWCSSPNVEE